MKLGVIGELLLGQIQLLAAGFDGQAEGDLEGGRGEEESDDSGRTSG